MWSKIWNRRRRRTETYKIVCKKIAVSPFQIFNFFSLVFFHIWLILFWASKIKQILYYCCQCEVFNSKFNCVRVWYVTRAKWSVTEQAAEENDKQRRVTQHSAVSNAALGGEKRRKRQRVTEKVVEEQQNNGGEQWTRGIEMDQVTERVRWTDMKQATDSVTRDMKCNCCSSIWHKGGS